MSRVVCPRPNCVSHDGFKTMDASAAMKSRGWWFGEINGCQESAVAVCNFSATNVDCSYQPLKLGDNVCVRYDRV